MNLARPGVWYFTDGMSAPEAPNVNVLGWSLATADFGRIETYFPSVTLIAP